ncbi:HAMP domain-containing histidine kinase [Cyanobacteria bacterium FACHB-DQ100]|nr:HAMP domain-containing histidine kinase [Cyanobacteria bacterium FACHB-DQ100]
MQHRSEFFLSNSGTVSVERILSVELAYSSAASVRLVILICMLPLSSTEQEIVRLRAENQQLSEQVKRLVRAERRMIESQEKRDAQVVTYRRLNEIGRQFSRTFSIAEIFQRTVQFVVYEYNFERCLILHRNSGQVFTVEQCEGYYDDDSAIASLVLAWQHPAFQPLVNGAEFILVQQDNDASVLQDLSQQIEMDEFVGFAIGKPSLPEFLILIGNRRTRAKYHQRIQPDDDSLLGLINLLQSVRSAISQANLYIQIRDRASALEQTLQELQQAQSQLVQSEKMSSLGQLVAGVAHEINNPVSFIYGNLVHASEYADELIELLKLYQACYPQPMPNIQARAAEIDLEFLLEDLPKLLISMKVGADRIKEIVASLRTFSRMDEADCKAVDLHAGIDSTLMILEHRTKSNPRRKAIEIIREYGNLPLIECYAGQLNQVFMNLISNAIDALEEYTQQHPNFSPQIRITTALLDSTSVIISISDNGIGIPEPIQSRLFDPFFTTKPVGKGTGMGLSISHQIITERHKGHIECISKPGMGTEFRITIPSQSQ